MSNVELPIRLTSVFPTWSIFHCFTTYNDMEKWLDERKLHLVSATQVGEYLCCIATINEITNIEKII